MAAAIAPELKLALRHVSSCVGRRLPASSSCGRAQAANFLPAAWRAASSSAVAATRLAAFTPPRLGLCFGAAAAAGLLVDVQPGHSPASASRSARCDELLGWAEEGSVQSSTSRRQEARARLHVVLDVDETLVHSQQVHPSWLSLQARLGRRQRDDTFGLELSEGVAIQVSKRPGLDGFLRWLQKRGYEVSLYTAGTRRYVEALLPRLDPEGIITQCLAREDCVLAPGHPNVYLKDLRRVVTISTGPDGSRTSTPADLARTVLVDNNPLSFAMQPENGILVRDWLGGTPEESPDDSEFERVKALLLQLEANAPARDVREVLPSFQKVDVRKLVMQLGSRLPFSSL